MKRICIKSRTKCLKHIALNTSDIVWEDEEIVLPQYDSMFVPYNADQVKIRKGAHLLYSRVKKG